MSLITVHGYAIVGNFDDAMRRALAGYATRHGHMPGAVHLHPDSIPADWPTAWPPVFANKHLNRSIIGLTADTPLSKRPPARIDDV